MLSAVFIGGAAQSSAGDPLGLEMAAGRRRCPAKITQRTRVEALTPGKKEPFATSVEQSWILESDVEQVTADGDVEVNQQFTRIGTTIRFPPQIGKSLEVDSNDRDLPDDATESSIRYWQC